MRRKGYDVKLRRTPHVRATAWGTPAQRDQRDHPRRSGDISGECHGLIFFLTLSILHNVPTDASSTMSAHRAPRERRDRISLRQCVCTPKADAYRSQPTPNAGSATERLGFLRVIERKSVIKCRSEVSPGNVSQLRNSCLFITISRSCIQLATRGATGGEAVHVGKTTDMKDAAAILSANGRRVRMVRENRERVWS